MKVIIAIVMIMIKKLTILLWQRWHAMTCHGVHHGNPWSPILLLWGDRWSPGSNEVAPFLATHGHQYFFTLGRPSWGSEASPGATKLLPFWQPMVTRMTIIATCLPRYQ